MIALIMPVTKGSIPGCINTKDIKVNKNDNINEAAKASRLKKGSPLSKLEIANENSRLNRAAKNPKTI